MKKIAIISPASFSQVKPMLQLAKMIKKQGHEVHMLTADDFKMEIESAGVIFREFNFKKFINTGIAVASKQGVQEKDNLTSFFSATKEGAVATLLEQARKRIVDLFVSPYATIDLLRKLQKDEKYDYFVTNYISFAVTVALKCLELRFATFVPGHPSQLPEENGLYGFPPFWPKDFLAKKEQVSLHDLRSLCANVHEKFTENFNEIYREFGLTPTSNAFREISEDLVLFSYPDFNNIHSGLRDKSIYLGAMEVVPELDKSWTARIDDYNNKHLVDSQKILLAFGTFLSERVDVLEKIIVTIRSKLPNTLLIVAAGGSIDKLAQYNSNKIIIERFIPQPSLIPHMDLIIHHAGGNSFLETFAHNKPSLAMPFATDEFAIAADIQNQGLGIVLNPNTFTPQELVESIDRLTSEALPAREIGVIDVAKLDRVMQDF